LQDSAAAEVATAKGEVEDQEAKIAGLTKLIDIAPQVEAQYAQVSRDYEETRVAYHALVDRLHRLEVSVRAAAGGRALEGDPTANRR
jgi:hypothetical protein